MVLVDLIFFGLVVLSIFIGYKRGLIKQAGNIAAVVLSFIFSIKLYVPFSYNLSEYITLSPQLLKLLSFIILFISFGLILILMVWILERTIKMTPLVIVDKLGGILLSVAILLIIYTIILYGLVVLPLPETFIYGLKHTIVYKIIHFILSSPEFQNVYTK